MRKDEKEDYEKFKLYQRQQSIYGPFRPFAPNIIPIAFPGKGLVKINGKTYWLLDASEHDPDKFALITIFLTNGRVAYLQLPKAVSENDIKIINHFLDFLRLRASIDEEESAQMPNGVIPVQVSDTRDAED